VRKMVHLTIKVKPGLSLAGIENVRRYYTVRYCLVWGIVWFSDDHSTVRQQRLEAEIINGRMIPNFRR